jgi:hypothetical protein
MKDFEETLARIGIEKNGIDEIIKVSIGPSSSPPSPDSSLNYLRLVQELNRVTRNKRIVKEWMLQQRKRMDREE